jgi:PAS domain S-box-containing protein
MKQHTPKVLIAGLQRRLLMLLIVVLLPLCGFFIASSNTHRQDARNVARENLQTVARLAALGAERHVEGTRQLLNAVSSAPSLRSNGLTQHCGDLLANIRTAYPYYTTLAFLDAGGTIVCDALKTKVTRSYKDRSYFVEAIQNGSFAIGDYQVGAVTGAASVGFGKPVYDNDAKLRGLAYAGLQLQQLAIALKGPFPADVQVTLTDRQGTILGTDPSQNAALVGTHLDDAVLTRAQKTLPDKALESLDPSGVPRLYAVAAVADDSGPGLYVLASLPQSTVTAPAWRELRSGLLWIAAMALLGILLARWIATRTLIQPTQRLVQRINQLANDDRAGPHPNHDAAEPFNGQDEIQMLSSAFDRFAMVIAERNLERDQQRCTLEKVQARLLAAQRIARIGCWEFDLASRKLWWSQQTFQNFGLDPNESMPMLGDLRNRVFSEDQARFDAAELSLVSGEKPLDLKMRMVIRGGRVLWFHARGELVLDPDGRPVACAGTIQEITDHFVNERLLAAEAKALRAMSMNRPLKAVLEEVLLGIESILPGARASVMLRSADGQRLHRGASLRLPEAYQDAIEGLQVGPDIGSCGTAAYTGNTVVVQDIASSPLWADYRELALSHGLRACWSIPLKDADGAVVATFAAYYDKPRAPLPEELAWAHSVAGVIGVAIQRDRHESALLASEQRFHNSFQDAAAGMAIASLDGRLLEVNKAYCEMLGYSEQELTGKDIQTMSYSLDRDQSNALFLDLLAGSKESFVTEKRYHAKDGSLVWIRCSISLLRGADGQPAGFIGIAENLNEQRRALDQLRLLETALSRLNDVVLITEAEPFDAPGPRIVYVNDAFERSTGYTREEAIGQSPRFLQGPETPRAELDRIRAALTAWEPVQVELVNYKKSGEPYWLELEIVPIVDDSGLNTHWVAVHRDITERKQGQHQVLQLNAELENRVRVRTAQLEAANRELEAFSYSVSHDLRSPLNTVNGFGQLLQKSNADNLSDKGKHYLNRIRAGTQQMGELIEGLLSMAKMSRNALRPEMVDLSAIALRVEQECREREPERPVALRVQPGLKVRGDPTLLLLVMQNLLSNAWKYTSKQPSAVIDVGATLNESGETVYFVRDNGAGFDMAHADKLFGAFQRLHTPTDFAGTGVGLANVKRVVERHGGRVWAEGYLQAGATFFFTIDCCDP